MNEGDDTRRELLHNMQTKNGCFSKCQIIQFFYEQKKMWVYNINFSNVTKHFSQIEIGQNVKKS